MKGLRTAFSAVAFSLAAAALHGENLAHLTFEPGELTWSDSVRIFQGTKGAVRIGDRVAASGSYSLELADEPGDGDFPELLARFAPRARGTVRISFALLPADLEEWQVALAGPRLFTMQKDGMSVWLHAEHGELRQMTDGIPKRLATIVPQRWIYVSLRVDLDRGRYDLVLRREGEPRPLAQVEGVWNAIAQPGSAVDRLSFISDPGDRSHARFFVDDVDIDTVEDGGRASLSVASSSPAARAASPLAPPGAPAMPAGGPAAGGGAAVVAMNAAPRPLAACVPAFAPEDVGLSSGELARLRASGLFARLEDRVLDTPAGAELPLGALTGDPAARAFAAWAEGCIAYGHGGFDAAARRFRAALAARPQAWLATLSLALAEAHLGQRGTADELLLAAGEGGRFRDPRYAVVLSEVARLDRDPAGAAASLPSIEAFLATSVPPGLADMLGRDDSRQVLEGLMLQDAAAWRRLITERLMAEQLYFATRDRDPAAAARFVAGMRRRLERSSVVDPRWAERAGDLRLAARDGAGAEREYRSALEEGGRASALWARIAAACNLRGDARSAAEARRMALATP